jgi:hypothetical protein
MFEYTKGVIRSRKSKDRQCNWQRQKKTNNNLQNITHKTKDRVTHTEIKSQLIRYSRACSPSLDFNTILMQNHLWDRRYVYSDQQIHEGDRTTREVKILTVMNTCVVNTCVVSLYYIVYQKHPEMVNKPWSIVLKSRDGEQAF